MKKQIGIMLIMISTMLILPSCGTVGVNGDQEAVLVYKPWIFGHGGVDQTPVTSGRVIVALSTDGVLFTLTPQAFSEPFENLISDDNVPLDFETHLTLQIRRGSSSELYTKFGENWYKNNISPKFRAMVRDKISSYKMQDLISNREIMTGIDTELKKEIEAYIKTINVPVDVVLVTIGAATPPEEVLVETQKTAAQNQSIKTQDARAKAEDARKDAEIKKALADQAYMQTMHMTIEQYMGIRSIEIEKEKVEVAKDAKNTSIIIGPAQPMYNIK